MQVQELAASQRGQELVRAVALSRLQQEEACGSTAMHEAEQERSRGARATPGSWVSMGPEEEPGDVHGVLEVVAHRRCWCAAWWAW